MITIKITEQRTAGTKIEARSLDQAFIMLVEKGVLDLNRLQKMISTHKSLKNHT